MRKDSRKGDEIRKTIITPDYLDYPEGSCLIETGRTRVICTASFAKEVPPFLEGKGTGWITSEYSMLPRATHTRNRRETQTKISGRTQEIQRLIGRSLRSAVAMDKLVANTIYLDCDVIQADGGTRTASINGAYVALGLAINKLIKDGIITSNPLTTQIAAVSVGMINGEPLLDLDYGEDSNADIDLNLAMNSQGKYIEIQGTSEKRPASKDEVDMLMELGWKGIRKIFEIQRSILDE